MQYYAYSRLYLKHKEDIHNPLRFQGQYFDAESGLHCNRHRYYNPNNGRFITADPIGLAGGLNNYQYVKNPTGYIDPLGLADVPMACACGSTYKERINQTPINGQWSGPRGESTFTSNHPETLGLQVPYLNGYPDFRGYTKHTVFIEDFINKTNDARHARYALHTEADKILAERLGVDSKLIKKFRTTQKFTWHEVEDMGTLQLVPTKINSKFGHVGGISEALKRGKN